jgi:hypothetical protein
LAGKWHFWSTPSTVCWAPRTAIFISSGSAWELTWLDSLDPNSATLAELLVCFENIREQRLKINWECFTGLDPAGPLFENYDPRVRLDSTDADLVDVIHSNGEKIYMGGLGAWAPMGDIDFYPNGGRMQKGCTNLFVGAVSDMIWCKISHYLNIFVCGSDRPSFACLRKEKNLRLLQLVLSPQMKSRRKEISRRVEQ